MTKREVIAEIPLTDRRKLTVTRIADARGDRIDVRVYDKTGPQFFPTKEGFSCPPSVLPLLVAALVKHRGT